MKMFRGLMMMVVVSVVMNECALLVQGKRFFGINGVEIPEANLSSTVANWGVPLNEQARYKPFRMKQSDVLVVSFVPIGNGIAHDFVEFIGPNAKNNFLNCIIRNDDTTTVLDDSRFEQPSIVGTSISTFVFDPSTTANGEVTLYFACSLSGVTPSDHCNGNRFNVPQFGGMRQAIVIEPDEVNVGDDNLDNDDNKGANNNNNNNTAIIAGAVGGGLALIALGAFVLKRRKSQNKLEDGRFIRLSSKQNEQTPFASLQSPQQSSLGMPRYPTATVQQPYNNNNNNYNFNTKTGYTNNNNFNFNTMAPGVSTTVRHTSRFSQSAIRVNTNLAKTSRFSSSTSAAQTFMKKPTIPSANFTVVATLENSMNFGNWAPHDMTVWPVTFTKGITLSWWICPFIARFHGFTFPFLDHPNFAPFRPQWNSWYREFEKALKNPSFSRLTPVEDYHYTTEDQDYLMDILCEQSPNLENDMINFLVEQDMILIDSTGSIVYNRY